METTLSHPPLNETQIFLLQTFALLKSEEEKADVQALLLNYVQQKLDNAANQWWEENNMTNEKMQEMLNTHYRTPYK